MSGRKPPSLEALFEEYDGKSVEPFQRAADVVPHTPDSLRQLTALAEDTTDSVEIGATWVVKRLLESGVVADAGTGRKLHALLRSLHRDEAHLHVLQCLPFLDLSLRSGPADTLFGTLGELTRSKNAFVRAWAYNGLGLLALGVPRFRTGVQTLFVEASKHESAAVKARIRHATKALDSVQPD